MPGKPVMNDGKLTIQRPDDWHLHLRDDAMMSAVLPDTSRVFARAIIMPNLVPPVRSAQEALAYRGRILAALPAGHQFTPLMTCYLTDTTEPNDVAAGFSAGAFVAAKLYPAGATTHSDAGVTDIARIHRVLERMERLGMPLLVHGEATDPEIDIFDREAVFVDRVLIPTRRRFPQLKVVLEHVSTEVAAAYVSSVDDGLAATVTVHHLMVTRNDLLSAGVHPHLFCMPVVKRESDRQALVAVATSGDRRFFLGTDSAPHPLRDKEAAVGRAGVYTAATALELYAEVFEGAGALEALEGFASCHGPRFYGLPVNEETVTLQRRDWVQAADTQIPGGSVHRFRGGETLRWQISDA